MEEPIPKLPYDAVDRLLEWYPPVTFDDPCGLLIGRKYYPIGDE